MKLIFRYIISKNNNFGFSVNARENGKVKLRRGLKESSRAEQKISFSNDVNVFAMCLQTLENISRSEGPMCRKKVKV